MKVNKKLIFTILALSAPAIFEMALNTMLGIADTIMLGRLINSDAIASVGLANQIMYMLIFSFSAFNTGAVAMISRAYGEGDRIKMRNIAAQNVLLNLIIGSIVMICSFVWLDGIFGIYDTDAQVLADSIKYFGIVAAGFIPMFLSFSFASILRGSGDTKTPMYITGITNVINIIGNYVLITGVGPFPQMGIAGAALSTTVSRAIGAMIYIWILYINPAKRQMKFVSRIDSKILKPLFKVSYPGAIEQTLMQLSFLVVGIFISRLTVDEYSVFRILIQIESLSFMPAVGFSIAAATLVGKSLGEKEVDKAYKIGLTASLLAMLWGVVVAMFFVFVPTPMIKAFAKEAEVLAIALPIMIFMAINQPGLNFVITIGGALRGAGDTFRTMLMTILRLWILFVPLSYLFILRLSNGVVGLWYAEIISIAVTGIFLYARLKSKKWASIRLE